MKKNLLSKNIQAIIATSALGLTSLSTPQIVFADEFTDALTGGKATVDIRVRYEGVDQKGTDNAAAFTERTRIGYMTGDFKGFSAFMEMSDTSSLGARDGYKVPLGPDANTGTKAIVLDPSITVLNQAWIGYKISETQLKAGEQRIIIDNRFLGNVGWRQKEQTYTGFSLKSKDIASTLIDYAYITNASNPVGVELPMKTHAFKAQYDGFSFAKLEGYAFLIDYDAGTDSSTMGARLSGGTPITEDMKIKYHLEYASQGDYADSKNITGGEYTRAELGLAYKTGSITLGQEKLGGDGTKSFNTPLATLHLYNGWADKFLVTPATGLVDNYIDISGKAFGLKLAAIYHDFSADKGSTKYGTEYDLLVAKKFNKIYTAGIKYAAYSADKLYTDTNKVWIWGEAKF
ncbi:hypothetical protein [Thiosulfativibrio zosterae]|uniref:Alginate export domain-containing protein n=1 Tax=Thiosulfativibrio zosterae TaxID=2675053 RepID=A0A6F8PNY3_9GAMM|nr:hypothetical protein [Thiosulfativibrio zosterae]BBP43754.1 hypothetical protein THMIRHAT_15000 [Thiosulfativibrio zosterae]